jgi:hypothetical protein
MYVPKSQSNCIYIQEKSSSTRMARSSTTAKSEVSLFLQYVEMAGEDVMKSRV